ncbi:unnamed protein product, partial [Iphiclides podalirius]
MTPIRGALKLVLRLAYNGTQRFRTTSSQARGARSLSLFRKNTNVNCQNFPARAPVRSETRVVCIYMHFSVTREPVGTRVPGLSVQRSLRICYQNYTACLDVCAEPAGAYARHTKQASNYTVRLG